MGIASSAFVRFVYVRRSVFGHRMFDFYNGQDIIVNSFKELIPRMNDIFIKLVTEEA